MILRNKGVKIEQEDDDDGFLWVKLECNSETSLIDMIKNGLIEKLIAQLGLENRTTKFKLTN